MKRIFIPVLFISLVSLFSLTGCGQSKTAAETPLPQPTDGAPSSVSLTSLHHRSGALDLRLGMTQQQVETALAAQNILPLDNQKPTEPNQLWPVIYGKDQDSVEVCYDGRTDTVVQLKVQKNYESQNSSNWSAGGAVSLSSSKADMENAYGTDATEKGSLHSYYFDTNGKPCSNDTDTCQGIVSFDLDDAGEVIYLDIIQASTEGQVSDNAQSQ
ncbi:MAG: hypothetical protein MR910_08985 [Clostridiales bacterium]|nr:hypothetical protein [Clostridiales bacterium]